MSMTLTCGNLVYVRTFKCAGTFYWETFNKLGWWEIGFDEIDWKNQRVFSHMIDPDQRRHKGVADYINKHDAYDLFYTNDTFKKFVSYVPCVDQYSTSYHDQYGNYCNLIDWIPLSGRSHTFDWQLTHQESVAKTDQLLRHHGIKVFDRWSWDHENSSSDQQKKLVKDLNDIWTSRSNWASQYLQRDRELYNRVITKFNYEATTWPESSWLGY